jgi:hypothetical protein
VLPWYLLAEWKTPGFLDYFIVGEHFKRFLVSNWQGDRYGNARGTICLFLLLASLPWGRWPWPAGATVRIRTPGSRRRPASVDWSSPPP